MKTHELKFKGSGKNYSIIIGQNILGKIPRQIMHLCPKTKKIALIIDRNVPNRFIKILKNKLKKYKVYILNFDATEKNKSLKSVNFFLEKLLSKSFNRSDLIISVGGGITGDVVGFIASIFKRGVNHINIPTTLLAQVDSSIGGKTGVNSIQGKNLIGSFNQPNLVISDTSFLKTLPKKEIICGYAEILKHSIIKDKKFFYWLKNNTNDIFKKDPKKLIYAIKKSCLIKLYFVNKDVNEKNTRMILNFGHTFAHAIETKNNYSKKISHGEAVLSGMILATRLSCIKKVCSSELVNKIQEIYIKNGLSYTYKKFSKPSRITELIPYLKNDKKNDDNNINFILIRNIGKPTKPNKFKISTNNLKKYSKTIAQY